MIKYCFGNKCVDVPVEALMPSKQLPVNVKLSQKYKQIVLSVKEFGLVEPAVICFQDSGAVIKILDGHLRVEALKELNIPTVPCIISPDEEAYTYNKHVNRLSVIQEQKMLRIAVEAGVPVEMLSAALGITPSILTARFRLLDGICEEVVVLLADKHVPRALFEVLKKMKPVRQLEVINIMTTLNNFTRRLALSLLQGTSPEQLVNNKNSKMEERDHRASIERLEREMAAVQIDTEKLSDDYGGNNLKLVIIKSHITKILDNAKVLHWLMDNNPEYLSQLKKLSEIRSL
ncbi:TPA: ParB N-terminal domain-containing protein [Salmonella enterica subsp. salamae]|nr:RepB plasmid partitioning protein [Salmonella enterica subsp. salamae]ECI0413660.1 RepB plasmid partitioning protein [Salmonella enterica subsp. salamae]EDW4020619.1 RepB plasmid partitioning protein [Salmonella enterica subsp. salamae]SQH42304.1 ParB/RepB/Spo0J family partition protein [Salmonella enterica]HAU3357939.1 ParB N-terminal domain-containing protein [Salmonella enterica subsp. salamae]